MGLVTIIKSCIPLEINGSITRSSMGLPTIGSFAFERDLVNAFNLDPLPAARITADFIVIFVILRAG